MKGALQESIGFIIIIVISALVLIFALGWLSGMWKQMTQISTYMTGQAIKQMTDSLRGGDDVILTTLPYQAEGVTIPKGSITSFKIGVKRTADAETRSGQAALWKGYFSLCIGKLVDDNACSQSVTGISFTYPKDLRIMDRGGIQMVDADMTILSTYPSSTNIEGFRVYVCAKSAAGLKCGGLSDENLFGYTDFIIHIK